MNFMNAKTVVHYIGTSKTSVLEVLLRFRLRCCVEKCTS